MSLQSMNVNIGADVSGLSKGFKTALGGVDKLRGGFASLAKSAVAVAGISVSVRGLVDAMKAYAGMRNAVQRVNELFQESNVYLKAFAAGTAKSLGMAESTAYEYAMTYGNLFKGVTAGTDENAKVTIAMMKASAVIASKTGRTMEDVNGRIRSGILGNTEAIEDLGIHVPVAMLKTTKAFEQVAGSRSWDTLTYQEQQQIRILAILEQANSQYGDSVSQISGMSLPRLGQGFKDLVAYAGLFITNGLQPILNGLGKLVSAATGALKALSKAFGFKVEGDLAGPQDALAGSTAAANEELDEQKKKMSSLSGVDEINTLKSGGPPAASAGTSTGSPFDGLEMPGMEIQEPDTSWVDALKAKFAGFKAWLEPIKAAFSNVFAAWTPLKDSLSDAGSTLFPVLAQAVQSLITGGFAPFLAAIGSSLNTLLPVFAELGAAVLPPLVNLLNTLATSIGIPLLNLFTNLGTGLLPVLGDAFSSIANVLSGVVEQAGPPLIDLFGMLAETVLPPLVDIFSSLVTTILPPLSELFTQLINASMPLIQSILTPVMDLLTQFMPIIQRIVDALLPVLSSLITTLANALQPIIDNVMPVLTDLLVNVGDRLASIIEGIMPPLMELIEALIVPLGEIVAELLPILLEVVDQLLTPLLQLVQQILPPLIKVVTSIIKPVMQIVKDVLMPLVELLINLLMPILEVVISVVEVLISVLLPIIDVIVMIIDMAMQPLIAIIGAVIKIVNTIMSVFRTVFTAVKDVVMTVVRVVINAVQGVIDIFRNIMDAVRKVGSVFSDIFSGIKGVVSNVADAISGVFKGAINFILKGLNALIRGVNKISFDVPEWVPLIGGMTFGFAIPEIPLLAAGGIVSGPTMAMVGEAGKEAVLPLERNTGWMDTLAAKINARGAGGSTSITMPVYLDGELLDVVARRTVGYGWAAGAPA